MWFPGEPGGTALADVLFGDYNPSGRLPITFPKSVGQIPFNFPAHPGSQGRDGGQVQGPLYPFGHGLSYTTFGYSNVSVSPERAAAGSTFIVGCDVTNTGARAGEEVVQLYTSGYLKQAQDSRDISEYAYKRGAASLLDFLDAERSYRSVQLAYRQALASYMTSLEQLKEAVGTRSLP